MTTERQTFSLPEPLWTGVRNVLEEWRKGNKVERLWSRDGTLWTDHDEADWLGWLDVTGHQLARVDRLQSFARDVQDAGFSDVLLLGMGGSSLSCEVFRDVLGRQSGRPDLHILDSTDPAQIRACEERVDIKRTLFIVSSKSGTTLETALFMQHFFERSVSVLGLPDAASHFVAVTDPGSELERVAERDGYGHFFHGLPSIGGRYSALSDFGIVPAAAIGLDVVTILGRAHGMARACGGGIPAPDNPGVILGIVLGVLANHGRDKTTLVPSPRLSALGAWLEQLLAESTGKDGLGLIPIDGEDLTEPGLYGDDRFFIHLKFDAEIDEEHEAPLQRLVEAGQPTARICLADPYDIGAEFFRWEIATAVAGSLLGINPFDQPDVEASKKETRRLTAAYEATGSWQSQEMVAEGEGMKLYADPGNIKSLRIAAGDHATLSSFLRAHVERAGRGDYFAVLAYVESSAANRQQLQAIRHAVRDARRVATCIGFGPRFLHSTGQVYKGGPNTGVFLQITCDDAADLPVPGRAYTFGLVKAAQAQGDFDVLAARHRRLLRVHIGRDVTAGLTELRRVITASLVR